MEAQAHGEFLTSRNQEILDDSMSFVKTMAIWEMQLWTQVSQFGSTNSDWEF